MDYESSVAFGSVLMPGGLLGEEPSVVSRASVLMADSGSVPRRPEGQPAQRSNFGSIRRSSTTQRDPRHRLPQTISTRDMPTELNGHSYSLSVGDNQGTYLMPSTKNESSAERSVAVWPAVSGTSSTTSKPKLLQKLEKFIRDEFAALSINRSNGSSRASLQVYREAFDMFMSRFRAYKPLLLSIKQEYELLLEKYAARLRCLPALEGRLATLQRQHARELQELQLEHCSARAALEEKLHSAEARAMHSEQELRKARASLQKGPKVNSDVVEGMREANSALRRALKQAEIKRMELEMEILRLQTSVETTPEYHAISRKLKRVSEDSKRLGDKLRLHERRSTKRIEELESDLASKVTSLARAAKERDRLLADQSVLIATLKEAQLKCEEAEKRAALAAALPSGDAEATFVTTPART